MNISIKRLVSAVLMPALIITPVSIASFGQSGGTTGTYEPIVLVRGEKAVTETGTTAPHSTNRLMMRSYVRTSTEEQFQVRHRKVWIGGRLIYDSTNETVRPAEGMTVKDTWELQYSLAIQTISGTANIVTGEEARWNVGRIQGLNLPEEEVKDIVLDGTLVGHATFGYDSDGVLYVSTEFTDAVRDFSTIQITYSYIARFETVNGKKPIEIQMEGWENPITAELEPDTPETTAPPETTQPATRPTETQPVTRPTETQPETRPPQTTEAEPESTTKHTQPDTTMESSVPETTKPIIIEPTETLPVETTQKETTVTEPTTAQETTTPPATTVPETRPSTTEADDSDDDSDSHGSSNRRPNLNNNTYVSGGPGAAQATTEAELVPPLMPQSPAETESQRETAARKPDQSQTKPAETAAESTQAQETKALNETVAASDEDLEVKIRCSVKSIANPGDEVILQFVFSNKSDKAVQNLRVRDYLPEYTSFVSCDDNGEYGIIDGKQHVTWNVPEIPGGDSVTMEMKLKIFTCIPLDYELKNRGSYQIDDKTSVNDPEAPANVMEIPEITVG